VSRHLQRKGLQGRTVTLKARLADFTTFTRQVTLSAPAASEDIILDRAWRLLSQELTPGRTFRLLGVGVSHFEGERQQLQLPLFEDADPGGPAT
jgi:DNA polymerase-4